MLKCVILDDDKVFASLLEVLVKQHPLLELVESFTDSTKAHKALTTQSIDVLLLDIEMPGLSGMDIIRGSINIPQIILITAHPEYAVEAFEFDVTDYIVKPISEDRFYKAIEKAVQISKYQELTKKNNELCFKINGKFVRITEDDIGMVQSYGDYIKLYERENRHVILGTLNNMQNTLNPNLFMRIHRKYIVNLNYIDSVEGYKVNLKSGQTISISRTLKSELIERIKSH